MSAPAAAPDLESLDAQGVLEHMVREFHPRLSVACSFPHDVPYNSLHDRGFSSIGCTHCTVPGAGRDGRWAGTDRIECGLHLPDRV